MNVFSPPRYPDVPLQPLPQTILSTMEHSGLPFSEPEIVTDIPPDFTWMSTLQLFDKAFVMKNTDGVGKELAVFNAHQFLDKPLFRDDKKVWYNSYWTTLPAFGSKWWNGLVAFKFVAIKPPRVTGKILITYSFTADFENNNKKLKISKEWDLGQSNECEFDVSALNQIRLRPTWSTHVNQSDYASVPVRFASQVMPLYSYHMGAVKLEVANVLQVGNLFPDSIRILCFRSFKQANFYQATDLRGSVPHYLALDSTE